MADDNGFRAKRGHCIEVVWEVKKFFSLSQMTGEEFDSPSFYLSNASWCISIFPRGDKDCGDQVSLFLMKKSKASVKNPISCLFRVKKTDGSLFKSEEFEHTFKSGEYGWGFGDFLMRSELTDSQDVVCQDGTLKVFCTVCVLDDHMAFQTEGAVTLMKHFKDLFLHGRLSDVKINVGKVAFKAHKSVLVARSPVFSAMFEREMAESTSGVVVITDCDPESFEDFLHFLYTGQVNCASSINAFSLYKTADKYGIVDLKEICSQRMINELTAESVCDVVHLAAMYDESEMQKVAANCFISNAEKIFATAKWQAFMTENTLLANEMLKKMAKRVMPEPETITIE